MLNARLEHPRPAVGTDQLSGHEQRLLDGALPAGGARLVEQLPVERDGDVRPRFDARRGDGAEARHRLSQLEAREADAVAGLVTVDRDENDAAVGKLAHAGPR